MTTPRNLAPFLAPVLALAFASTAAAEDPPELLLALTGRHAKSSLGVLETVRHVLKTNPRAIEEATSAERGPLRLAILYHELDVVNLLLEHGASPEEGIPRENALQTAIREKQTAIARLLLDNGAKLQPGDVVRAVYSRELDLVELLVARGAPLDVPDPARELPLQVAAAVGDLAIVTFLLERGASPHVKDAKTQALHRAAGRGHPDVVRLLLDRGAEIDAPRYDRQTPIQRAVLGGRPETIALLAERGAKLGPFALAALGKDAALREQAGLKTARLEEQSLLHVAVRFGHLSTARLLADAGLDVNAQTDWGLTPLILAAKTGNLDLVTFLLDRGAKINHADRGGTTALHAAASAGETAGLPGPAQREGDGFARVLALLVKRGADLDAPLADDLYVGRLFRPIHCAAAAGRLDLVKALQDAGSKTKWDHPDLNTPMGDLDRLLEEAKKRR